MHPRPPIPPPWRDEHARYQRELPPEAARAEALHEGRRTVPLDPLAVRTVAEFVEALAGVGFQGGRLAGALATWRAMLRDPDCLIYLGLSGAVVPAGLGRLLAVLLRRNLIDVVVSTGAQVYHDLHESTGGYHYHADPDGDDEALRRAAVNRFYNVAADDLEMRALDLLVGRHLDRLPADRAYSTRAITAHLAALAVHPDTLLAAAAAAGKPIYVPTFHDSSLAFGPTRLLVERGRSLTVDHLRDNAELYALNRTAARAGAVLVGGGVPKNYIQQIVPLSEVIDGAVAHEAGLTYGVQFTAADARDGGLSGCTMSESKSWGKYHEGAAMVQVWGEATVTFSLVATALLQTPEAEPGRRPHRRFAWPSASPTEVTVTLDPPARP